MTDFNLVDANGVVSVRDFANKSVATRYANKHGLTVAKSVGALALIADAETSLVVTGATVDDYSGATDGSVIVTDENVHLLDGDVDTLLESLDSVDDDAPTAHDESVTLRDHAKSFDVATVDNAVFALRASFDRRDSFEESNGLSLVSDSSYVRERNRMLKNEIAVSRFFLALGISASDVIERKVSSSSMFNAKALKKVTELAQYVVSYGVTIEKVTRAFIACALIASDRGHIDITNDINRKFLNGSDFSAYISDQELIDYLRDQRHVAMTSGAETQSSQARNVLDVLGLGVIKSVHKNRDAIALDTSHSFYSMFRGDFMK